MAKFDPHDGGKVPRAEAEKWIKKYDDERHDKAKDTRSVFFGKDFLRKVLSDNPECAGITFFFSKKHSDFAKKDVLNLVLVPCKEDGTLIWPETIEGKDASSPSAYNLGRTCPPDCS